MEKALQTTGTTGTTTLSTQQFDVEKILLTAIEKNTPVDTMQRLLAMRREMLADLAKQEYDSAMSEFQASCPTIQKHKKVYDKHGKYRYSYAPMDDIISQVKEPLQRFGFSYLITSDLEAPEGKGHWIVTTCKVTHKAGHSEVSAFKVPVDKDAFMSEQQKFASALTYAKRYAFCNAFGILTGDEDNDANDTAPEKTAEPPSETPAEPSTPDAEKLIAVGMVKDIAKAKTKTGGWHYSIQLVDDAKYYTFDVKIPEYVKKWAETGEVTIAFTKGQFGKDITDVSFADPNADFRKFCEEANAKKE